MQRLRTRVLFALSSLAAFAATSSASAQCPPAAPTGINPVTAPSLTVSEGTVLAVSASGGGPAYEWDTDCDGSTAAFGDMVSGATFTVTGQNRDGFSGALFSMCVRSMDPTCPAATRYSPVFRTQVAVANTDPVITSLNLPNGAVGTAYAFRPVASDPANPPVSGMTRDALTWSATGLPPGLTISTATGEITGTPTMAGSFNVTLRVVDGDGGLALADISMQVVATPSAGVCAPPTLVTTGMVSVNEGGISNVQARVTPGGGCVCRVGWDLNCDGTTDQFGLTYTVNAAGRDGPSSMSLCVRSFAVGGTCVSTSTAVNVPGITVANAAPTIITTALPNGAVGSGYVTFVQGSDPANPPLASGVQDGFTWSATGLPPGLTIDPATGIISGTPTMMGSFTVNVSLSDGDMGATSRPLTITVTAPITMGVCPTAGVVTPGPSGLLVAEGGASTVNTTSPGGTCGCVVEWDLNCDGSRDGTGATFSLSGVDRDGASTLSLCHRTVPGAGGMCTMPSPMGRTNVNVVNVAPTITNVTLPVGTLDVAYTATMVATDPANPPIATMVRDPITWSATGLPPGLALNATTGVISGTPDTAMGAIAVCYPVTVTASDADGGVATRTLDLCVTATMPRVCPAASPVGGASFSGPEGASTMFTVAFGAGGACGCEVAWDYACDGSIEAVGISTTFNAAGFDGPSARSMCWVTRPTPGGMCNAASARTMATLNVTNVAPTITTASLSNAMSGAMYTATITATDPANPPLAGSVQDPFTWSLTGAPAWLSIDAATGVLTGTPPAGSDGMSFAFTVTVTDGDSGSTSRMFTLSVGAVMVEPGPEPGPEPTMEAGTDAEADASVDVTADVTVDDADATMVGDAMEDGGVVDQDADASVIPMDVREASAPRDGGAADAPDASPDGGMVTGGGTCACRTAGAPGSSNGAGAMLALFAAASALVTRRRRR